MEDFEQAGHPGKTNRQSDLFPAGRYRIVFSNGETSEIYSEEEWSTTLFENEYVIWLGEDKSDGITI